MSKSARDNSYVFTTVSLWHFLSLFRMAAADPQFFQKGFVSMRVQGKRPAKGMGEVGLEGGGGRVTVRVMSEYVDFLIWISEEFEVLFISRRLPRRLHGDHCKIRESLFGTCLQTLLT